MRDILNDLDYDQYLSDPDPVKRAQIQMRTHLPKRFYKEVSLGADGENFAILLDGRPVKTPGKAPLVLPTEAAAQLVADEFAAQVDVIDPVTMPVLRLANTAIDGISQEPQAVVEDMLRFAGSDLLCYRADAPDKLVERQAAHWDPVLGWARATLGARFILGEGVMHVAQPEASIAALRAHMQPRAQPLRLAAMHVMTSLTGSAVLSIATEAGGIDAETAWLAAHVDESWQIEQWGLDAEAEDRHDARKLEFLAAVGLLEALGPAA